MTRLDWTVLALIFAAFLFSIAESCIHPRGDLSPSGATGIRP